MWKESGHRFGVYRKGLVHTPVWNGRDEIVARTRVHGRDGEDRHPHVRRGWRGQYGCNLSFETTRVSGGFGKEVFVGRGRGCDDDLTLVTWEGMGFVGGDGDTYECLPHMSGHLRYGIGVSLW